MKTLAQNKFSDATSLSVSLKKGDFIGCYCGCELTKLIFLELNGVEHELNFSSVRMKILNIKTYEIFDKKNGSVLYFKGYNIDYLKKEEATIDIRFYNLLLYLPEPK